MGTKALNILNIKRDNLGRILVTEVKIDDSVFVLFNIQNANTEPEQLHTLNDLINILETFKDIQNKIVVLGGDINVILNASLDSKGGTPIIKKKAIAKLTQITENLDLFDIWRICNPKKNDLLLGNTILLVLFKDVQIIFSYPILSKNLLKPQTL